MSAEHPPESVLGLYALNPAALRDRGGVEAHLAACVACRNQLAEIQSFDALLRDPDVWLSSEQGPAAASADELRTLAVTVAEEDSAATQLLAEFMGPDAREFDPKHAGRFAWVNVAAKPSFQTAGVARLLCRQAHAMLARKPLYALAIAEAAVAISKRLPDDRYPRRTVHELRGEALKENANALHQLGRLSEALAVLDEAQAEYEKASHPGLGLVAVTYIRAAILYEQDQYLLAETLANEAAAGAIHLGAIDRYLSAQFLRAEIKYERGEIGDAARLFALVRGYGEKMADDLWTARGSLAVGICYLQLGCAREASDYLHAALRVFTKLGAETYLIRTKWAIAQLLFHQGKVGEGIHRVRLAVEDLSKLGMLTDAALAAIDVAEMLNASGRKSEIPKVLSGVVQTFARAGKVTSALAALAYLKDAAAGGTMTYSLTAYVRRFVSRADRQPELLFAPPPHDLV